jgi:3-oxoacyl-[acyl-carrier protein] reductase
MGGDARAVKADVANQFWVKSFFDETLRSFGRIDLVVNTSLIPSLAHSREGGTLEEAVATNRRGAYLVLTQAARLVADGGSIVVVSDRAAFATSHPPHASCMASDVRMEGYLYELASELRDRDVSVNIIECLPDRAGFSLESETEVQNIYVGKHAHLVGQEQPVDIAGVVSFLAGPDGHLVTSQVLCASDCAA